MNVSSSSYYNKASSSNGFSGLASGIDTESMVEAMLANTQAKIDKQNAVKQQVLWKQEIYRSIITKLNTFQNKWFSTSSATNLLSSSFYNNMTASINGTSKAFKVSATSSAIAGKTTLKVDQLATATKMTSGQAVSGKLEGTLDTAKIQELMDKELAAERSVTFTIDGQDIKVNFTDLFASGGAFTNKTDAEITDGIINKINQEFSSAGYGTVTASISGGTFKLTNSDPDQAISISSASTADGLKLLGLSAGKTTGSSLGQQSMTGSIDLTCGFTFNVSLDDVQKSVTIDLRKATTDNVNLDPTELVATLKSELDRLHGAGQIEVHSSGNNIEFKTKTAGRKVLVGGSADTLALLGFKNGQSNRIGMGGQLNELYFSNALQGDRFKFTINGVSFSFNGEDTITDVINAVNSSDAGVKISYKSVDDKFVIESTSTGDGYTIDMSQEEGNLLNAMFGAGDGTLASGGSVSSVDLSRAGMIVASDIMGGMSALTNITEGTFKVNVNGTNYSFKVADKGTPYTMQELANELNSQFASTLGEGTLKINATGNLEIAQGATVKFTKTSTDNGGAQDILDAEAGDLALAFGFALDNTDNITDLSTTLEELGLKGNFNSITNPTTATLQDLLDEYPGELSFENGRLIYSPTGGGTGLIISDDPDDMMRLFGSETLELGDIPHTQAYDENGLPIAGNGWDAKYEKGVNAKVVIDGYATERSSNSFTVNGLNIELTDVTGGEAIVIDVARDVDNMVGSIKSFMAEYNALIDELNGLIREDTNYRKYDPLTDEQKKEMTEREIELWEEKAKEGLLRGDSTIENLLYAMRSALYTKPEGAMYYLFDLGIETSSEWRDYGKLVFSDDGEAKLRQMLETNSEEVMKLFTDSENGIAVKLNNLIKGAANTSSGSPGSLVQIAGSAENKATDMSNTLYSRLEALDKKIEALKLTYEKEKSRYWRQFNSMEQLISNMNQQSAWLASVFTY